eukprot:TRINITY_DN22463_c0_g1_i1.p1 TRINITY_DN22463_c0_g1~~TRINITY_DN22463_c0_g1_i1.p1  ORF type:complete len:165 (-),score=37.16 TRINITY_DN22463_c0_g1_i1:80-574(-)
MDLGKLCEALAREEQTRGTALLQAAERGNNVAITRLLQGRANPNVSDSSDGQTPLHLVAKHGHADLASALLDANADPLAKDAEARTPWAVAKLSGSSSVQLELLRNRPSTSPHAMNLRDDQLPKGIEAFLKQLSLAAYAKSFALWCYFEEVDSVAGLSSIPEEQ